MHRPLLALAALCAVEAAPIDAQFQATNRTARRLSMRVSEIDPALSSTIDIEGPRSAAGTPIVLLLNASSPGDVAHSVLLPPLEPLAVDLFDPSFAEVPLTLPPSGDLSLPLAPTGAPAGTVLEFQAVFPDAAAANGWSASNGVRRVVGTSSRVFGGPAIGTITPATGDFDEGEYVEIEQGDVDGDGDPDTVMLTCLGELSVLSIDGDT